MPNLEVTLFNQRIKLAYQENEKQRLLNAVEILNKNWNKFSDLHGKVTDIKIVTLISLELQDSIKDLQSEFNNKKDEISKIENVLDELHTELLQIKSNLLKKNYG